MASPIHVKTEAVNDAPAQTSPSTHHVQTRAWSASEEGTPSPPPRHKWTIEERVTLALLAGHYQMGSTNITRILQQCHMVNVRANRRPSVRTVMAQWAWMRPWFTEADALRELTSESPPYGSDKSKLVGQDILEEKARVLGIECIVGAQRNRTLTRQRKEPLISTKRKLRIPGPDVEAKSGEPSPNLSGTETDFLPLTPKRQCHGLARRTPPDRDTKARGHGLLTPPSSSKTTQQRTTQRSKRLPSIAFRAYDVSSQGTNSIDGFRAGSFVKSYSVPPSPSPNSEFYLQEAARHVAKQPTGVTPFISLSRNLLRCLHRAIKAGPDSSIAVIDMEKANSKGAVQSAMALRIKANCVYKPWGEYLVWAQIPKPAIISVVPLTKLLAAMPTMPGDGDPFGVELVHKAKYMSEARTPIYQDPLPMSFQSGQAIGKLMKAMAIPSRIDLLEGAVYSIISDWKFSGKWKRWQKNTAFREGLEKGYFGEHNGQLLSLVDSGEEDTSNLDEEPEGIEEEILPVDGTNQTSEIEDEDATISLDSEEELQENPKQRIGDIANYSLLEQPNLPNEGTFVDGFIATREDLIVDDDRDNRVTGQRIGQEILSKIRAEEETKLLQLDYAETCAWTGM